jgi:hypothetical protein
MPKSYLEMSIAKDIKHDIKNFLERPIRIWSGQFSTTNTQGQVLFTDNFPDVMVSNTMYAEKLSGFVGLRADMEIKVQVNAQKFQQGRLRLQYIPYAKYMQSKVDTINYSITGRTACPGVDIDICGGSNPKSRIAEAVFHVPFVSPHTYFNLINSEGSFGTFYLFVYSPLLTGSSEGQNCEVTIWARFINPQLAFPTGATIGSGAPPATRTMIAQIRGEAKQIQQTGVVSSTLGVVADTLKVAKKIPVIGEYLAIPEWICDKGASIAKLFGWSKPTISMDTKLRTQNNFANYNGKDSSHKMALSADNEIDTPPGLAGTKIDEMALTAITSVPAYWSQFQWTNTNTVQDQILWIDKVTPAKISEISGTNGFACTPIGFVSNLFGYWRGSLKYTFKMVKTGFHAGRLRVFFVPQGLDTTLVVGSAPTIEIEKNYQVVVDIEDSDTFSFTVPYVATKPWYMLRNPGISGSQNFFTGYVVVTVLNELRNPSTVSNAINVLVEVSGGSDLTFALPGEPTLLPGLPTTSSSEVETQEIEKKPETMIAQIAGTDVEPNREQSQMLMDPNSISILDPESNWTPESHCIGEKIMSVRQLLKRNQYIGTSTTKDSTQNTLVATVLNPYGNNTGTGNSSIDYMSYFMNIYAFFRGGVRIKTMTQKLSAVGPLVPQVTPNGVWYCDPSTDVTILAKMYNNVSIDYLNMSNKIRRAGNNNCIGQIGFQYSDPSSNYTNLLPGIVNSSSTSIVKQSVEGCAEFEIPYYNSTHITPAITTSVSQPLIPITGNQFTETAYPLPFFVFTPLPSPKGILVGGNANSATMNCAVAYTHWIFRSAADDFGLMYLLGMPTLITPPQIPTDWFQPSAYNNTNTVGSGT